MHRHYSKLGKEMEIFTSSKSSSSEEIEAAKFLIKSSEKLKLYPIIKYSALSLFTHRFLPSLTSSSSSSSRNHHHHHWLLKKPLKFPHLQLFSLISLWISSKIYNSPPISLKSLKSISDQQIRDQHFTKTDFLDAEIVFLQSVSFEVGTLKDSAFLVVEELLMKLKEVAKVGEMMSFEVCCDVMDLVYESGEISRLVKESPMYVAAAIIVSAYAIAVPKQSSEFPVVGWVNFVTGCSVEDVMWVVKLILNHVIG